MEKKPIVLGVGPTDLLGIANIPYTDSMLNNVQADIAAGVYKTVPVQAEMPLVHIEHDYEAISRGLKTLLQATTDKEVIIEMEPEPDRGIEIIKTRLQDAVAVVEEHAGNIRHNKVHKPNSGLTLGSYKFKTKKK